ncbi:unnamed protein product [Adineta ricciae]|uniref:Uncharacterized protein n=1 Tax=Adineta ricciae TaxID=249248 RepID=A0A813YS17_ADIRI|nr:unnamed protein product [Adineta ricciae]CAF0888832.1 unnamed protein product [Adineta ricciae]
MDSSNETSNETSNASGSDNNACFLSDEEINQAYNLTLHIVSVFVLLVVSFVGASLSVVSNRFKALRINPIVLNFGKFFGSGVVLATGFVHILPDAMETLTDPCLPDSWNVYGAYAGLFAMLGILGMQLIEFLAHEKYRSMTLKHSHGVESTNVKAPAEKTEELDRASQANSDRGRTNSIWHTHHSHGGHAHAHTPEVHYHHQHQHSEIIQVKPPLTSVEEGAESNHHHHGLALQNSGHSTKISTYLLEFGIALHSILIGLTLGTATDSFVALFIALCFHQFFEAIALGAQIANLKSASIKSAIFMVIFFSLTTPIGIAIGIGIHSGTYNPKSVSYLLSTGILDSFAAGILIYVALVNLITAEMGVNAHGFNRLSKRLKFAYFVALYLGVAAMAVIGRWA